MSQELSKKFRTALMHYLQNPFDVKNKKKLTAAAFAIYDNATQSNNSIEPDKFMTSIDEIVRTAVRGIKVHPYLAEVLDSFSRELSMSDLKHKALAFNVLTLTYNWYLKENVIDIQKVARKKLARISATIQQLKVTDNPYVTELESALEQLTSSVKQYLKLSPVKQVQEHEKFEKKLQFICSEHQAAIASDVRVKSAFYSFLATIFSIFNVFGFSLADEYQRKNRFFQEVSLIPKNTLSDFRVPFIEVKDTFAEQEDELAFTISIG
ncbi:hypothetical protein OQJ19_07725 [Fluoribacter gormanii]|uniref:Uncharacterized protein n=1 Tax=Fluoribacter gormanii TaxID=464 RepID=A0A377GNW3_9GAMM|nr:hypothetical protein [Fluoribacter gormanii]KTD04698.1 hypothetical protein Lgor_0780 [Fluoribacter gormanii]MCW8470539.1 hypothetical protein [Fluoribacter gormanii]SIR13340.1 hypothetical protein SAMN05421777_10712 [Fluoribacter gormanii]STO26303.1 Uncharacterised protein [Fluoribacter gormanii]